MATEWRPYFVIGYNSIAANNTESVEWTTGASEELKINKIRIHSTGAFDITKIVDQGGIPFTNASSSEPIDSNLLTAATKNEYHEIDLPLEWNLGPNTSITFSVKDTSGSTNEVFILGIGSRRTL